LLLNNTHIAALLVRINLQVTTFPQERSATRPDGASRYPQAAKRSPGEVTPGERLAPAAGAWDTPAPIYPPWTQLQNVSHFVRGWDLLSDSY